jgi:hypothetical protein
VEAWRDRRSRCPSTRVAPGQLPRSSGDVVTKPPLTPFIEAARARGCKTVTGTQMSARVCDRKVEISCSTHKHERGAASRRRRYGRAVGRDRGRADLRRACNATACASRCGTSMLRAARESRTTR